MSKEVLGYNDTPVSTAANDKLEMMSYVDGFSEFLTKCSTPITISVSGEWGSGKTTFMNLVNEKLKKTEKFEFMTFPVWMYNTISPDELTSILFLEELTHKLVKLHNRVSKKDESERKQKTSSDVVNSVVGAFERIKAMKFKFNFMLQNPFVKFELSGEEKNDYEGQNVTSTKDVMPLSEVRIIVEFKENLQKLVNEVLENDEKLLIFIDDLDRLTPIVAVELLEIIKMLLDIEKVIFVIAIDFEVVKNGVIAKYGELSSKNPEDYFEKMIQVNYSMPVERYKSEKMYQEYFKEDIESSIKELVDYCIPAIPRKIKKFLNNFLLVKSMYSHAFEQDDNIKQVEKNVELDDEIILLVEAIRQKDESLYLDLINVGNDVKKFVEDMEYNYIENNDLDSKESEQLKDTVYYLKNIFEDKNKQFENKLISVLQFTHDFDGKPTPTMYKYKDGKEYNADEYTMKFQEEFREVFTKVEDKIDESIVVEDLIGNGSAKDILSNTIGAVLKSGHTFENVYTSRKKTMVWLDSNKEIEDWRKSNRIISMQGQGHSFKIDLNISRKDAYVYAMVVLNSIK